MRVFINCSNLRSGGGLTVGLGIVSSLYNIQSEDTYVILLPSDKKLYPYENNDKVKVIRLNKSDNSFIGKIKLQSKIKSIAKSENVDAILSLSNYAIKSDLPQSLMLHWPYAVYPEKELWDKMSFINKLKRKYRLFRIKQLLSNTNNLIVQTDVMKSRVEKHLDYSNKITIIPSGSGFSGNNVNKNAKEIIESLKNSNNKVFLCINEYYEQKNLEILIPLAQLVKSKKLPFRFIITLDNNSVSKEFINQLSSLKLQNIIINVGRIKRSETKNLFETCDALFFPSLLESYGIPMVEALETELPIYVSDKNYAHTICKENAIYFNPNKPDDIISKLQLENKIQQKVIIPKWNDITLEMLKTLK